MATVGNTEDRTLADLRAEWFGTSQANVLDERNKNERVEHLIEILKRSERANNYFNFFKKCPAPFLVEEAKRRMDDLNNGLVEQKDVLRVEGEISVILAAGIDYHRVIEPYYYNATNDPDLDLFKDMDEEKLKSYIIKSYIIENKDSYFTGRKGPGDGDGGKGPGGSGGRGTDDADGGMER